MKAAVRAVEVVLRRWDPIGVDPGEVAPADECDSYAPHIVFMLTGGCSVVELADHLERIRTEMMGLDADRDRNTAVAEELVVWCKQRAESGPSRA